MSFLPTDATDWMIRGFFMTFGIAFAYFILYLFFGKRKKGLKTKLKNMWG